MSTVIDPRGEPIGAPLGFTGANVGSNGEVIFRYRYTDAPEERVYDEQAAEVVFISKEIGTEGAGADARARFEVLQFLINIYADTREGTPLPLDLVVIDIKSRSIKAFTDEVRRKMVGA